jgi:hypothetical protein
MPEQIIKANRCWMRTYPKDIPSEFVTKHVVAACVRELLKSSAKSWIAHLIRKRQDRRFDLYSESGKFKEASGF